VPVQITVRRGEINVLVAAGVLPAAERYTKADIEAAADTSSTRPASSPLATAAGVANASTAREVASHTAAANADTTVPAVAANGSSIAAHAADVPARAAGAANAT